MSKAGRGDSISHDWTPIMVLATALILLYLLWKVLLVFIFAAFFAFIIHPLVDAFPERLPRIFAIILTYVILLAFLSVMISTLIPVVVQQYTQLADSIPEYAIQARNLSDRLQARYGQLPAAWRSVGDRALAELQDWAIRITRQSIPALVAILTSLFALVLVPLLAFFMLLGGDGYKRAFIAVMPEHHRETVHDLLACTSETLWKYIKGQSLLMIIVGVLTGVGLYLVGVPYPAVFGLLAGLLELVPNFGPITTSVLVGIVSVLISPVLALKALSVTIGVQLLENSVLVPVVMGRTVGLDPVTVAFAIFLGGSVAGVVGAIIAVPLAMLVKIMILYFYARSGELPEGESAICRPENRRARESSEGARGKHSRRKAA